MNYWDRLKLFRKQLGLNQTEMGSKLGGIPQTTYSQYENGSRELPIDVIEKLTQIGLNVGWLISGTDAHRITALDKVIAERDAAYKKLERVKEEVIELKAKVDLLTKIVTDAVRSK